MKPLIWSYSEARTFLKKHIEEVHGDKKHQCSDCGEIFQTQYKLETHIVYTHDRSKLFNCSICNSDFRTKQALEGMVISFVWIFQWEIW